MFKVKEIIQDILNVIKQLKVLIESNSQKISNLEQQNKLQLEMIENLNKMISMITEIPYGEE